MCSPRCPGAPISTSGHSSPTSSDGSSARSRCRSRSTAAGGVEYSNYRYVGGLAGTTRRPPIQGCDVEVRARATRIIYGERGVEIEVRRTVSGLDVGFFVKRTGAEQIYGVRLQRPMPP